ncbi:FMRFamide receptor-like [Tigriopus californicus]|nr:FMRFamide receptor-like [Tigriopus californicus]
MTTSTEDLTIVDTTLSVSSTSWPSIDPDLDCGTRADVTQYQFWCDGVLLVIIGLGGFVGNLMALVVLSRPKLRDVFHQLLLALACFDILYIICGGVSYTFRAFQAQSDIYTYLFPHLIYPLSHVAVTGTIFMTLAISIERYLGLCHPMLPPHSRKAWFYIVPVVVIAFALNVPKFMEVELEIETVNGTDIPFLKSSQLRYNENYVRGYIMWTRLFSTAIIPVTMLLFLNTRIIIDLFSSKVQRFGSTKRQRREINLCFILLCIVFVFFICHACRIFLDVYEFSNVEKIIQCAPDRPWLPEAWGQALPYVSHFMMILNSSVNFIVYCLVGHTFRRELCRTLGIRDYMSIPGAEWSRRTSRSDMVNGNGSTLVSIQPGGSRSLKNGHRSTYYNSPSSSPMNEGNKQAMINDLTEV